MTGALFPAVFLDRDGVINCAVVRNGKPYPPDSINELIIMPNAELILSRLREAGYLLIGITNQPDVARGKQRKEIVEEINEYLLKKLPVTEIFVCYHDDKDKCYCRKPNPGLLLEAASKYSLNLSQSFMVGDRWKDIQAGQRAGCKTIFLDHGYLEPKPDPAADYDIKSLEDLLSIIL